jgi:DNA repair protein RecO (recombination protein O)
MMRLVAKGVKRVKTTPVALLQPFQPLLLNWSGRGELKNLLNVEIATPLPFLKGERLYCGFYLNELIHKLIHPDDPFPDLFAAYAETLHSLTAGLEPEPYLRRFELVLLSTLGMLPDFSVCSSDNTPIDPIKNYQWVPEMGFIEELHFSSFMAKVTGYSVSPQPQHRFIGGYLLGIQTQNFENKDVLMASKRLARLLIHQLLKGRSLRSRDLIIQARKSNV